MVTYSAMVVETLDITYDKLLINSTFRRQHRRSRS